MNAAMIAPAAAVATLIPATTLGLSAWPLEATVALPLLENASVETTPDSVLDVIPVWLVEGNRTILVLVDDRVRLVVALLEETAAVGVLETVGGGLLDSLLAPDAWPVPGGSGFRAGSGNVGDGEIEALAAPV
ncbi:hypothetical protein CLAFUW4_12630 [Fulvia fulva]|uniref:Secreted protein n=1 Tax=Passalora fulva TaxID=5499 RepID=A0A9Q8PEY3_PASFU|nr:uncharacterized protein CLAFUR5_11654 [Fulvia fulva]KAK4617733.1 hypothetical protein CLAFUR4_12635 [Fulvia fulva]KAK4619012.1 hypothetical protein CLAFUR0_12646 [Fulvia fulva]UJO21243.1 hypothetical protein CLAFUR5_11654 [Fulvia fulva]WPV18005.1 hypothetical protein CLAFUW4_12630 [Fulvia fulva]WPV32858.1 hypothetical protein CLAFUW7_12637 [Fulvia fulva]